MYRILVADDEGIMLEAFKNVISSTFGDSCIVETAKTGRAVTDRDRGDFSSGYRIYGYSYAWY